FSVIRRDLCDDLCGGDTERAGDPDPVPDLLLQLYRKIPCRIKTPDRGDIEKGLVNADLLDPETGAFKDPHDLPGHLCVPGHVGPKINCIRAEPVRLRDWHCGFHAECPGLVRTGGDNAPPRSRL